MKKKKSLIIILSLLSFVMLVGLFSSFLSYDDNNSISSGTASGTGNNNSSNSGGSDVPDDGGSENEPEETPEALYFGLAFWSSLDSTHDVVDIFSSPVEHDGYYFYPLLNNPDCYVCTESILDISTDYEYLVDSECKIYEKSKYPSYRYSCYVPTEYSTKSNIYSQEFERLDGLFNASDFSDYITFTNSFVSGDYCYLKIEGENSLTSFNAAFSYSYFNPLVQEASLNVKACKYVCIDFELGPYIENDRVIDCNFYLLGRNSSGSAVNVKDSKLHIYPSEFYEDWAVYFICLSGDTKLHAYEVVNNPVEPVHVTYLIKVNSDNSADLQIYFDGTFYWEVKNIWNFEEMEYLSEIRFNEFNPQSPGTLKVMNTCVRTFYDDSYIGKVFDHYDSVFSSMPNGEYYPQTRIDLDLYGLKLFNEYEEGKIKHD